MLDKLKFDEVAEAVRGFAQGPVPRQILSFDEMLTPRLLQVVYWAALVAVIWAGLGRVFSGSLYGFIEGVVFIALGCLIARVLTELVMLFFQMHENMQKIASNTAIKPTSGSATQSTRKVAKRQSKKVVKKA